MSDWFEHPDREGYALHRAAAQSFTYLNAARRRPV
jgi:hypothetical protein